MATKLEKKLTRESKVTVDDRNVMVNLNPDQTISLKLKGLRTGEKSIGIEELYNQLNGISGVKKRGPVSIKNNDGNKKSKDDTMISLTDLRSANAISTLSYDDKVKFESIILNLINRK